jgi:hypothetical protein
MQVVETEPKFKPVQITLESQFEVDVLLAALARVVGNSVDDKVIFNLYQELGGNTRRGKSDFPLNTQGQITLFKRLEAF